MIAVTLHGDELELLPFPEMVEASQWFAANDCPTLASLLWREGDDLSDEEELQTELQSAEPPLQTPARFVVDQLKSGPGAAGSVKVATSEGIVVAKFNPYHDPGSGEFASGGGGGGSKPQRGKDFPKGSGTSLFDASTVAAHSGAYMVGPNGDTGFHESQMLHDYIANRMFGFKGSGDRTVQAAVNKGALRITVRPNKEEFAFEVHDDMLHVHGSRIQSVIDLAPPGSRIVIELVDRKNNFRTVSSEEFAKVGKEDDVVVATSEGIVVAKFNPYHDKGTGEFSSGSGGGGGNIQSFEANDPSIASQVGKWSGARGQVAQRALTSVLDDHSAIRDGDKIVAVAAHRFSNRPDHKGFMVVDDIATGPGTKSYGRQMMEHMAGVATKKGAGMHLIPLPKAEAFYTHLGFEKLPARATWELSANKTAALAEVVRKATSDILEPEDGVFVKPMCEQDDLVVATSEGIVVAKFNPYHVPGGSPAGGQFAEGGGGQAGGGLLHMQRGSGLGGKWTPDDLVRAGIQSTGLTLQNVKFRWSSKPEAYAVGRTITISRELQSDPRGLVRVVAHEAEHVKMTRSGETFNLSYGEVEQRARIAENIAERFVFGNRLHPLTGHVIEEKS